MQTYSPAEVRGRSWPRGTRFAIAELPVDYVGAAECARICGVTRPAVANWRTRGWFPEPDLSLEHRDYWLRRRIQDWARRNLERVKINRTLSEPIIVNRLRTEIT